MHKVVAYRGVYVGEATCSTVTVSAGVLRKVEAAVVSVSLAAMATICVNCG